MTPTANNAKYKVEFLRKVGDLPPNFESKETVHRFYIRLNTPSYRKDSGMGFEPEETNAFNNAFRVIFETMGFSGKSGFFYKPGDGFRELFAHPDSVSGVLCEHEVYQLCNLIQSECRLSTIRAVDFYESFSVMSGEQMRFRVRHYADDIRAQLVEQLRTKRRNRFVPFGNATLYTRGLAGLGITQNKSQGATTELFDAAEAEVAVLVRQLQVDGYLFEHTQDGQNYYRTANKSERRVRRLPPEGYLPVKSQCDVAPFALSAPG